MVFLTVSYHRTGRNSYFAGTDQRAGSANCELLSEIYVRMVVRCKLVYVCVCVSFWSRVGKIDFIYFILKNLAFKSIDEIKLVGIHLSYSY